jgi:hypothetical protein
LYGAASVALVVLALAPAASSTSAVVAPGIPQGLHAFLLQAGEPVAHQYSRTPAFTWSPVAEHGGHYQFELSTSPQ